MVKQKGETMTDNKDGEALYCEYMNTWKCAHAIHDLPTFKEFESCKKELDTLRAENERLREALKKIESGSYNATCTHIPEDCTCPYEIAKQALAEFDQSRKGEERDDE